MRGSVCRMLGEGIYSRACADQGVMRGRGGLFAGNWWYGAESSSEMTIRDESSDKQQHLYDLEHGA